MAENTSRIEGKKVWVTLTQGKETCVDLDDWNIVKKYRWWAVKGKGKVFYAKGFVRQVRTKLHQFLYPSAFTVDHKDGDGLNKIP